jgi:ribosomal protein L31E
MTKPETSTQAEIDVVPGVPLEQFEAAIEAFKTLREQGRFAIFQGRGDSIRLIGEPEELVISLQRMSGIERMDLAKAKSALEEIRTLIQVSMVWNEDSQVLSLLESNVFDDHFTTAKKNPSAVEKLRQVLRRKLELAKTLVSPAMLERAKRLSTLN